MPRPRLRIFAYGSNLCLARMTARVPSARVLGRARLAGHALRFHKRSTDGSGKANVVAEPEPACVWGVVYEIEPTELPSLDRCEPGYVRRELRVEVAGAGSIAAHVYVADAHHIDDTLKPLPWYKSYVVEGAQEHGLPPEYVRTLTALATLD